METIVEPGVTIYTATVKGKEIFFLPNWFLSGEEEDMETEESDPKKMEME